MKLRALDLLVLWIAICVAGPQNPGHVVQVAFAGYIDPTVSTYNTNKPMRCTANVAPGLTYTEQNRQTMQFAVVDAATNHKRLWIPRCRIDSLTSSVCPADDTCAYPISGATSQPRGVDFNGASGVIIESNGGVIRGAMAMVNSGASYQMLNIRGSNHVRLIGLAISMRDITNGGEQVHAIQIGDGTNTKLDDDVQLINMRFVQEPSDGTSGGDCINTVGGLGTTDPTQAVTRVTIAYDYFNGCHRDAIDFSHGYQHFKVYDNRLIGTAHTNQLIDNEPTTDSFIGRTIIQRNTLDRGASPAAQQISLSGLNDNSLMSGVWIDHNICIDCSPGSSLSLNTVWITHNDFDVEGLGTGGDLSFTRRASNIWMDYNHLKRGPNAVDIGMVAVKTDATNCTSKSHFCIPRFLWFRNNDVDQWVESAAVLFDGALDVWVGRNKLVYHASTNGSSSVGPRGVSFQTTTSATGGWVWDNKWIRGLQVDGVTRAGTIWAGVGMTQTAAGVDHLSIRDNAIDGVTSSGVTDFLYSNATSFNMAPVVVSGNQVENFSNFAANGIKAYAVEATRGVDSLTTSGALNPGTSVTLITGDCGTDTFTLPACVRQGQQKTVLIHSSCLSLGTLTPTSFGDGTSLSWSVATLASPARVKLICDETNSWRVRRADNVTVNP